MRRQYTASERRRFFNEVRESGESIEAVAKRFGIGKSTAYKWHQRAKEGKEAADVPKPGPKLKFARVVPESRPAVFVEIGGATLRVEAGFDAELLRGVVAALDERRR